MNVDGKEMVRRITSEGWGRWEGLRNEWAEWRAAEKMNLVGEGAGLGSERVNGGKETVDGGQGGAEVTGMDEAWQIVDGDEE